MGRGEHSLRPAGIRAETTLGAVPKQFIYLADWLDPFLQTADCLFEGKPKVLFCAPGDPPFPFHQWGVKVLGTQCLQVCLRNPDFDKVLVKTGAGAGARMGRSESFMVLSFSFCFHKIRKCQVQGPESTDSLPAGQPWYSKMPIGNRLEIRDLYISKWCKFTCVLWSILQESLYCNFTFWCFLIRTVCCTQMKNI